jgi:two-component sensor histidine kinase
LRRALEKAEEAARQRDFLLQEMNHRVKNKFAMIHSIIGLQARAAPPEARESLDAIDGRVKVMASVHDYLQLARHDGEMDMAEYLNRLCTSLSEALGALRPIAMTVDVDPIRLPPAKALSAGLIVNELVTNVYKYAFPLERSGRIDVSLKLTSGVLILCIKDDGVGSAADARKGLGTTLVNVLAGQLGGSVNREALSPGWLVTVTFEP